MSSFRAYYSIVQYCPDRGRAEAANVGVLLLCPELHFVRAKMAKSDKRIAKFFGRDSFDAKRVHLLQVSLEARVRDSYDWSQGPEDLQRFIATRANDIQLTPLRTMKTSNPSSDIDLLFDELVGERTKVAKTPQPAAFVRLREGLKAPGVRERISFNETVEIPVLGKDLSIPYVYRNGVDNLVKPVQFKGTPERIVRDASELAVEGDLLRRHPTDDRSRRLILVPAFANESEGQRDHVLGLFGEYDLRVVNEDAVDDFVSEISRIAHN